jgi:crotonobetainyl-CoA:carnitine CoA-transferase CaiB-like acyl-CoA transferase
LGFSYDEVAAINPKIVYTNCYGYGRRGPDHDLPAYDDTIQAECGLPAVQELLTGEANYVGTIMADKVAGLTALYATTMALFHRDRTGEGQEVEVAMFETMASFMLVEHANGAMFDPRWGPRSTRGQLRRIAAPLQTPTALFDNPHLNETGFFETLNTPHGPVRFPGVPTWFSRTAGRVAGLAPQLGADTAEVLDELGLGADAAQGSA